MGHFHSQAKNYIDPRFRKTLVFVKFMVLKYRPRLNIIEHQLVKPQVNFSNVPGLILGWIFL